MNSQVAQLRRFNRTVTRRIGALDEHFLGRDRPLGESRLLFEIGREGAELKQLRARLGLDSGYISRLLRSLEGQGLVETAAAPHDARVRKAVLTRAGLAELDELNRLSDKAAEAILTALPGSQRGRLIMAMAEVERLLRASDIEISAEPADSDAARWCVEQYFALLNARFERGYNPGKAPPVGPEDFTPPGGIFLVARAQGDPVGCGSLRTALPGVGEIRRLWVAETARGLGLGQRLLERIEAEARAIGLGTVRLDTNKALTEARALYLKNGYREVPPFNDDPHPDYWFEKSL